MSIDFSKCKVCSPAGEQLRRMQRILWEIFPYDRPVYDQMLKTGESFYTLENIALFCGDEFLGNTGLMPMKLWLDGTVTEIVGVGAVATVPKYRRMGVARYLMAQCMQKIDSRGLPAVLFTELPVVYEEHGFRIIDQYYPAADISGLEFNKHHSLEMISELDETQIGEMAEIHEFAYPAYDGKVVRDKDYWQLYKMLFNPYPKPLIVFCRDAGNKLRGYARFETESDRLTITEFCCDPDANSTAESLLARIQEAVAALKTVTIALPPEHFVFGILGSKGASFSKEPGGVRREIFMARAAKEKVDGISKLLWSLADKF